MVFAVQPGSGDSLQFMKAGIVEIPDVAVVTKADLGGLAERARRDLEGALGLGPAARRWQTPVLLVAATTGTGWTRARRAFDRHAASAIATTRGRARQAQARPGSSVGCATSSAAAACARWRPSLPAHHRRCAVSPFRWLARAAAHWPERG